ATGHRGGAAGGPVRVLPMGAGAARPRPRKGDGERGAALGVPALVAAERSRIPAVGARMGAHRVPGQPVLRGDALSRDDPAIGLAVSAAPVVLFQGAERTGAADRCGAGGARAVPAGAAAA